jgi:hypothetical protein
VRTKEAFPIRPSSVTVPCLIAAPSAIAGQLAAGAHLIGTSHPHLGTLLNTLLLPAR